MEGLGRRFLYRPDHSLSLAVGPGVVGFGEAMLDAIALAGATEDMTDPGVRHALVSIDELGAIISQDDVDHKQSASGKSVTYYYAWKGGPRLEGEPGSAEFIATYNRAVSQKRAPRADLLVSIFDGYQDSTGFADLAERTRKDYRHLLRVIDDEFGNFPIAAPEDRRTRGEFLAWRERLAVKSCRQADYAFAALARTLS